MNYWILSSGILSIGTMFLHIIGGGREVHVPVLESELSTGLKAILSIIWHAITAILAINGAALLWAAASPELQKPLVLLVSFQYLAFAILFIFYGWIRLGTLLPMPQWIIFIALAGLALAGL